MSFVSHLKDLSMKDWNVAKTHATIDRNFLRMEHVATALCTQVPPNLVKNVSILIVIAIIRCFNKVHANDAHLI